MTSEALPARPAATQVTTAERLTEAGITGFLWAFRIAVVLIVVVGSSATLVSGRYGISNWVDLAVSGLVLGSVYALISLGYTMVYGILRMINFAHGDIFMAGIFGGYYVATALAGIGFLNAGPIQTLLSVGLMIVVAVIVAVAIALIVERIAYRPLRNAPRLVPLISAIGASFTIEYTFRGFLGPGVYAYPGIPLLSALAPLPIKMRWVDVLVVVSALAMMAILYLFVQRTKIGTAIRAVSEDKAAAALMGIDVNRAIVTTFGVGAAMAGAAGVLYGLEFRQANYLSGFVPGIKAFTAAVLGGIGNIPGAMLGGLVLGEIESIGPTLFLAGLGVPSVNQLRDVIAFTMLVLILVFRPQGLLGERISSARA
jgi:branched-chain amino acid transport system permease protein